MKREEVKWKNTLDDISEYEGFVYLIEHKETKKAYIGKKSYWSRTTKKIEGRKNRKHILKESDWKKYTSSNKYLKEWIKKDGVDKFIFKILKHCRNKIELTYYETYYQFNLNVLTEKINGEYKYINENILGKFYRTHLQ